MDWFTEEFKRGHQVQSVRNSKCYGLAGLLVVLVGIVLCGVSEGQVERVWLSHKSKDPSHLVVSWTTKVAGESVVRYGGASSYGRIVRVAGSRTLHHVQIPLNVDTETYHYLVETGSQTSQDATFKAPPQRTLRVAVVADWQGKPDLSAVVKEDVHLLLTAGDNINNLWRKCGVDKKECFLPYAELIDAYPALFRSVPIMPVLGNHDREIRPRGKQPADTATYDIDATAFTRFFELPGDEWKWSFEFPAFGVRFVALDFNHISDFGSTWQTCHAFGEDSKQFRWYEKVMEEPKPFVVTLYNERNANIRNQAKRRWHDLFRRGTCCITGFGYYAERADVDGFAYYNTSLNGMGNQYPDPNSKFLAAENTYLLLTVETDGPMTVQMKSLAGKVLDQQVFSRTKTVD